MQAFTKERVFCECLPLTIAWAFAARLMTVDIKVSVTSSKLIKRPLAVVKTLRVLSRSLPKSIFLIILQMVLEILLISYSELIESILS